MKQKEGIVSVVSGPKQPVVCCCCDTLAKMFMKGVSCELFSKLQKSSSQIEMWSIPLCTKFLMEIDNNRIVYLVKL